MFCQLYGLWQRRDKFLLNSTLLTQILKINSHQKILTSDRIDYKKTFDLVLVCVILDALLMHILRGNFVGMDRIDIGRLKLLDASIYGFVGRFYARRYDCMLDTCEIQWK